MHVAIAVGHLLGIFCSLVTLINRQLTTCVFNQLQVSDN